MALNLPLDEKLEASINRRRIAEEQRKKRIFNSKVRQIGVDVDALKYQMHEKALLNTRQTDQENKLAEEAKRIANEAELLEQQENEELKNINKRIDQFRLTEQKPEFRRDFDLYDPNLLKKSRPPRISDYEQCPISGLQRLEGEDLEYKDRMKCQKEQMRELLLQQIQEKRMQKYKFNRDVHEWETQQLQQDAMALQMLKCEKENQDKMDARLKDLNRYLAMEATERKIQEKMNEDIEKRKDIQNTFYGDLLSENPLVARSAFGPHRVVPDRWKGMSKEQIDEYRNGQIQQIIENERKKEKESYETARWNSEMMKRDNYLKLLEEEEKQKMLGCRKDMELKNKHLEQEQTLQQKYMNKVVYTNVPSQDYYSQFNTTSR